MLFSHKTSSMLPPSVDFLHKRFRKEEGKEKEGDKEEEGRMENSKRRREKMRGRK